MPSIDVPYRTHITEAAANTPIYSPLNITFLMDEEFQVYKSLLAWMTGFIDDGPWLDLAKDIRLFILSANKTPLITFDFITTFPVNIPDIPLESNVTEPVPILFTVEFRYQYFQIQ
jgi:hypothetical protein